MPTYDYKCENCGHAFELFQSMKEDPVKECPSCGELAVKRLIGAGAGLMFKGSGFYLTDYAKNGNGKTTTGDSSATPSSTDSGNASGTGEGSKSNEPSTPSTPKSSGSTDTSASGSSEAA